jgi:hypothetical protein
MIESTCTFDEATHTYRIAGRQVPSVTQVLGDLIPGWHASDWHLQRGRAVHAAAAFIAREVPFDSDPQVAGQVAACLRFFREVKPMVIEVERPVYSPKYQFAGCLDLLTIRPGGRGERMVLDFKSSLSPSVPFQVAGYAWAAEETLGVPVGFGCGVELRADGTYRMSEIWHLPRFKIGWLSLLSAYNIRRRCGIAETGSESGNGDAG